MGPIDLMDGLQLQLLLCNFLAQTEALMKGKTPEEVEEELKKSGKSADEIARIKPHKVGFNSSVSNDIANVTSHFP